MKEILDKYNDCDVFSLTYQDDNVNVKNEEKINALENIINLIKKELISKYNKISKKYNLLDFDVLYKEIEDECLNLEIEHKDEYDKEDFYEYSFAADFVGEETKYCEPFDFFWEFYHEVGLILDRKKILENNYNKHNLEPLDIIKTQVLKDNLIKYDVSFYNHCTVSNKLMINYYFNLNETTRMLLESFRTDFDIDIDSLEDLGLYKKNKLIFSSSTHEKINNF